MSNLRPFELRAGMQLMQRLILRDPDVDTFRRALEETVAQAPAMFQGAPVVLDLGALREMEVRPDFAALAAVLRGAGIVPAGVGNATPAQCAAAQSAGWAVLGEPRETPADEVVTSKPRRNPVRVVDQPVRSGQQIHASGDLMLLAPVSAGAEVLAEGSIYVHAPLRGRALAGIRGDASATISCSALHAELVSVAGHYRTLDAPEPGRDGGPAYIYLDGEQLRIETV